MNKNAIVVVSFGTSYDDTREKNIGAIENLIKEKYKNFNVYRAFTSNVVLKVLKKRDIIIMNVTEIMEMLFKDGVNDIIVQPTHIIPGEEFDKMCNIVKSYKDKFNSIKIGIPLLYSTEDLKKVAIAIASSYNLCDKEALVLMGHGTTHYSNTVYPSMNYIFRQLGYKNIFVGTVEGYPDISNIIGDLKNNDIKKIYLAPMMLVAGDHAVNDMSGDDENSWESILQKCGYDVIGIIKGLGEYPAICDIYMEHIENLIGQ